MELEPIAEIFFPSETTTRAAVEWCMARFDAVVWEAGECWVFALKKT